MFSGSGKHMLILPNFAVNIIAFHIKCLTFKQTCSCMEQFSEPVTG